MPSQIEKVDVVNPRDTADLTPLQEIGWLLKKLPYSDVVLLAGLLEDCYEPGGERSIAIARSLLRAADNLVAT